MSNNFNIESNIERDKDDLKFIPLNIMEPFTDKNSNWFPTIDSTLPTFNNIPDGFVFGFASPIDNSNLQGTSLKTLDFTQKNDLNMQNAQDKNEFEEDFDLYYPSETLGEELFSYNKDNNCKDNNYSQNMKNKGTYKNNNMNWQNGNMNNQNPNMSWQNGNMNNQNPNVNWQSGNMNNQNPNMNWQSGNMNNQNPNMNWQNGNMNNPTSNMNWQSGNMNNQNPNMNCQNGNVNNTSNNTNWQNGNVNNTNNNTNWENGNVNNQNNDINCKNGNTSNQNNNINMNNKNDVLDNNMSMPIIQNRNGVFQEPIHMELLRNLDFEDYLDIGFRGEENKNNEGENIFTIIKDDKSIIDTFRAYNIPKPIYEMIIKKIISITVENSK